MQKAALADTQPKAICIRALDSCMVATNHNNVHIQFGGFGAVERSGSLLPLVTVDRSKLGRLVGLSALTSRPIRQTVYALTLWARRWDRQTNRRQVETMEKLIYGVNAVLLFLIARYEYTSDSDKTIIISSLAFIVLLVLNLIFGVSAQFDKKPVYRHYYYSALGLFVNVLILLSIW